MDCTFVGFCVKNSSIWYSAPNEFHLVFTSACVPLKSSFEPENSFLFRISVLLRIFLKFNLFCVLIGCCCSCRRSFLLAINLAWKTVEISFVVHHILGIFEQSQTWNQQLYNSYFYRYRHSFIQNAASTPQFCSKSKEMRTWSAAISMLILTTHPFD